MSKKRRPKKEISNSEKDLPKDEGGERIDRLPAVDSEESIPEEKVPDEYEEDKFRSEAERENFRREKR